MRRAVSTFLMLSPFAVALMGQDSCGSSTPPAECDVDVAGGTLSCVDGDPASIVSAEGGLVLSLNMAEYSCLTIDLEVDNARSWLFNLGDSDGNDGSCGDDGSSSNDSNAWIQDGALQLCSSDRDDVRNNMILDEDDAVSGSNDTVSITVCDGTMSYSSSTRNVEAASEYIFQIDGDEPDPQAGGKNDQLLWLGLNRTIYSSSKSGSGILSAHLTFNP